jgi:hypothetical protein
MTTSTSAQGSSTPSLVLAGSRKLITGGEARPECAATATTERPKITYEEACQAFGEPRDLVDKVALFATDEAEATRPRFSAISETIVDTVRDVTAAASLAGRGCLLEYSSVACAGGST